MSSLLYVLWQFLDLRETSSTEFILVAVYLHAKLSWILFRDLLNPWPMNKRRRLSSGVPENDEKMKEKDLIDICQMSLSRAALKRFCVSRAVSNLFNPFDIPASSFVFYNLSYCQRNLIIKSLRHYILLSPSEIISKQIKEY